MIEVAQVTFKPSAFALAMMSKDSAVVTKRGMVAHAGQFHEPDVAIEHDRLRLARGSGKAKARGEFAFVHNAFGGKIGVLGDDG